MWLRCTKLSFYHGGYYSLLPIYPLDYNVSPNIIMEQKRKGWQGIRAIEAFEYENTRSYFKYCEKNEKLSYYRDTGDQRAFSDKVTPNIDGFTDEPIAQYDVQVVENI